MIINQDKKINIGAYILAVILTIALIVVFFMMYKYQVEGEAVPPFKISKMIVVSSAKTENLELIDGVYNADIIQNNDIKISIIKNPEYKKEAIIRKITINNIQIDKKQAIGDIEIYRPSRGAKLYDYKEEYKIQNNLEYVGAQETYLKGENLEISNQGGIIEFSIIESNIQKLKYNENETVKVDGTLLRQIGKERLSYKVYFDLIIELESDLKLKTKITLDLPTGDIFENGIETLEKTNMKTIFKRI
jgi:hypothetical protein